MKHLLRLLAFFMLFSLSPLVFAWNAFGHMVVASIAYQNLKPATREKIDNLVDYMHQQYADMGTFLNIAYWPDSIRGQKIETYTHWHYIDVAFSTDGTPLKNLVDTDNAVWAINNIEPVVKNDHANAYERARFLAFLTHIVADLHQPLHTVSYISAAMPDGDKGGNSYFVRVNNERLNLHKLWDGGLGVFDGDTSNDNIAATAKYIMERYPQNSFGNKASDLKPDSWIKEGMANAKQYAYNTPENQPVSQGYLENGKRIAEQQAALAGYRLANLLNQLVQKP
jgi:hypothetical protein